nr:hypothetical protein [Catenulispora acidiphila]
MSSMQVERVLVRHLAASVVGRFPAYRRRSSAMMVGVLFRFAYLAVSNTFAVLRLLPNPVGAENYCDDLRFRVAGPCEGWSRSTRVSTVALKLIYLVVVRAVGLLRLSQRDSSWKDMEILILRHQLAVAMRKDPRIHRKLTWADRALLGVLVRRLPGERLAGLRLIVTPGMLLRWHRDILRRRWAAKSRRKRPGRPRTRRNVRALVLRLARENEAWGYRRIHGELAALGIAVAPSTVWEILKKAGMEPGPAPDRSYLGPIPALPRPGHPRP